MPPLDDTDPDDVDEFVDVELLRLGAAVPPEATGAGDLLGNSEIGAIGMTDSCRRGLVRPCLFVI